MTTKQKLFKEGMVAKIKGISRKSNTQIAIDAGYSEKTAYSIANENLNKPEIKAEIDRRTKELEEKTEITIKKQQAEHIRLQTLAEQKGDLATATRNLELIGKTIAAYADKSYNLDVIEHNPQSLISEEDILRKRLAVIEAAKSLPSGIEGR